MGKIIDGEQFKKYKSVALLEPNGLNKSKALLAKKNAVDPSSLVPPRQLQYLGVRSFEVEERKLRQNVIKEKEGKEGTNNISHFVKNGINLKESLSFASIFKGTVPQNAEVVGRYLQVRNSKGDLLRRRSIGDCIESKLANQATFLTKIGIISGEERNNHNLKFVKNRKSNYELPQFYQEKKEFRRLKEIATSLPKLGYYYAKKEQTLFNNRHKLEDYRGGGFN